MAALGGLFRNLDTRRDPWDLPPITDALEASRSAEILGNVRAAGESEKQRVSEAEAKKPQPTRSITQTENPDGTITRTTTVKNAPKQDPVEAVKQAEVSPHIRWLQKLGGMLDTEAEAALPDEGAMDAALQSREGRVKLLRDAGIRAPERDPAFAALLKVMFSGGGIRSIIGLDASEAGDRQAERSYNELLDNPKRVREVIRYAQLKKALDLTNDGRGLAADVNAEENQQRLLDAEELQKKREERMAAQAAMSAKERAIDNIHEFDLSHMPSADDAVKHWKATYPDQWGEWGPQMEPLIRSEYHARGLIKERKALEDARKDATDRLSRERLDLQIRNIESLIGLREKVGTKPKKLADDSSTDAIVDATADDAVDQIALRRTANTRLSTIAEKMNRNIAKARVLDKEITFLQKIEAPTDTQAASLEKKKQERANVADENQRLFGEKQRLIGAGHGGRGSSGGGSSRRAPAQKLKYDPSTGSVTPR